MGAEQSHYSSLVIYLERRSVLGPRLAVIVDVVWLRFGMAEPFCNIYCHILPIIQSVVYYRGDR